MRLSNMHDICVISTFLPLTKWNVSLWNELGALLQERGILLMLLTTTTCDALEVPHTQIPYLLSDFVGNDDKMRNRTGCYPASYSLSDAAWAGLDKPPPTTKRGLAHCTRFYQNLLDQLSPCSTFAWNTTVPQSRILHAESIKRGISAHAIERGFFPNTLMIESRENSALSDLNLNPIVTSFYHSFCADTDRIKRIEDYYARNRFHKYKPKGAATVSDFREKHNIQSHERIAVLFGSASAANWQPRQHNSARFNSPYFTSLAEAAHAWIRALPAGYRAVIQSHPIDTGPSARLPGNAIATSGEDIYVLLESADLYAFLGCTTTQQEALLYQRPVVLLSRSQLSGKGIAYEYTGGDLVPCIAQAVNRQGWSERTAAAYRYLDFVFQHFLYGYHGAPTAHNLEHLADFISATSTPSTRNLGWSDSSDVARHVEQLLTQTH